jgi:uridine phosphorylase
VADTIHLHPTASLAQRVLLPGDPGRALALSQSLLSAPKMFNHNRGLWGYTGIAADGRPLTIQSTGMGGPSAAIVIAELSRLGARRMLQVGTCAALDPDLELGHLVIVEAALATDGTSRALGASSAVSASRPLLSRLGIAANGGAQQGVVACSDVLYTGLDQPPAEWRAAGACAVDMETATLFTLSGRFGLEAGAVLIVSDLLPSRRRITPEALAEAEVAAGGLAATALS